MNKRIVKTEVSQEEYSIFDLKKVNDLPKSLGLKENILFSSTPAGKKKILILELFEIKSSLSLNEITVGLFRKFSIEMDRRYLYSLINQLKNKGLIKRTGYGRYTIM